VRFDGGMRGIRLRDVFVPGGGLHQARNAVLSLAAASEALAALGQDLDLERARSALETTELPARAEVFGSRPPVLIDGAHTGRSCAALAELVRFVFGGRRIVLVAGLTKERSVRALFSSFLKLAERAVFAPLKSPRSADASEAAAAWRALGGVAQSAPSAQDALGAALSAAGPEGAVVVAGSFYLAGELRSALRGPA
jgi:dihydrofolate synthase/folylpolyglutamate synthase